MPRRPAAAVIPEPAPPQSSGEVLDLSGETPFAVGNVHGVYAWPGRPDLLIKVVRPGFSRERWTGFRGALKRRRRIGVLASTLRTLTEHLVLRGQGLKPGRHVQDVVGLAETSEGIGLVVHAVRDRSGGYAPTLLQVISEGRWGQEVATLLDEFNAWLLESPLVVGDLHLGNLVLAWDETFGERVVMIDGMGDKAFIPVNSLLPFMNRLHKKRRIARLNAGVARRLAERGA